MKFNFDKKEQKLLTIEIEGKKFSFNPFSLAVPKASEKFTKCQPVLINKLKSKNLTQKDLSDIVIKSCILVKETVNSILGKGSHERIFAGRTVDFEEHQKLMIYLFDEITAFSKANPRAPLDESIIK